MQNVVQYLTRMCLIIQIQPHLLPSQDRLRGWFRIQGMALLRSLHRDSIQSNTYELTPLGTSLGALNSYVHRDPCPSLVNTMENEKLPNLFHHLI